MIRTPRRRALCAVVVPLVVAALAAGCATTPRPSAEPLADPVTFLQSRERFELEGRVAGAVGGEGFNAQLDLKQRGAESELVLRSPLGFGSATIRTDGQRLEYRSSRGDVLEGDEGLAAIAARLGFEPPVRSLRYWLMGVPDPGGTAPVIGEGAPPGSFEQQGWRVSVAEWKPTTVPAGVVPLPRRITLERPPVRLRVVVDEWKLDR